MSNKDKDHIIEIDSQNKKSTILLNKKNFQQISVMKTLRLFSDKVYCEMFPDEDNYVKINFLSSKRSDIEIEEMPYKFYNAVIDQQIREDLLESNKDIQKLIFDMAFSPITNRASGNESR